MRLSYRIALACGLIPITAGTIVFIAWLFTNYGALEITGIIVVYSGLAFFALGIVSLFIFVNRARLRGNHYRKPTVIASTILLLNFPVCGIYSFIAYSMETARFITIVNRSPFPIDDLTLIDPIGRQFPIQEIGSKQVHHLCPKFAGEGVVRFTFNTDNKPYSGVLVGYITESLRIAATMEFSPALQLTVSENYNRISVTDFFGNCTFLSVQ